MKQYDAEDIWRYLTDAMDSNELEAFEIALKTDTRLQNDVAEETEMLQFVQEKDSKEAAIRVIHDVHKKMTNQAQTMSTSDPVQTKSIEGGRATIIKYLVPFAVAASLFLGYLYLNPNTQQVQNSTELYASYFQPKEMNAGTRSENSSEDVSEIVQLFNDQKYVETLSRIENLPAPENLDDRLDYIRAISLIASDKSDDARTVLFNLAERNPIYKNDVLWYTGLSYLKEGNEEDAKITLLQIPDSYSKSVEVKKILDQL